MHGFSFDQLPHLPKSLSNRSIFLVFLSVHGFTIMYTYSYDTFIILKDFKVPAAPQMACKTELSSLLISSSAIVYVLQVKFFVSLQLFTNFFKATKSFIIQRFLDSIFEIIKAKINNRNQIHINNWK